ncbi:hypothetical protein ASG49_04825 [Marmoricola sp. Leaf446]|uniref:hypothetical protein n=1 Tax=Marmoricola sp. Leaf446 TaxID=1736379 RepID=UPI0006FD1A40|nr:hypothetical protein [Marmoricola sp. Leaf446]KQT94227.1 hypothetical protein ASG49_04825 [Marmoricola sp. Leaf446]
MATEQAPRVRAGQVTPAPGGPHVEQVGWGVARQVARLLAAQVDDPLLARLPELAEAPGHVVHVLFERRTATAAALVELVGDTAFYRGDVVLADAVPQARLALLVRASYDAAAAGATWLAVPHPPVDPRALGLA